MTGVQTCALPICTIGSATSGATERANADTQDLFEYLWNTDSNLSVSGGRGANAAADWAANKTMTLPDWRGRVIAALDDMGNSAAGRLSATYFGAAATTLGAAGGAQNRTIAQAQLPNITPTFTGNSGTATATTTNILSGGSVASTVQAGATQGGVAIGQSVTNQVQSTFTPAGTISSINGGVSQTDLTTVQPTMLATVYLKL